MSAERERSCGGMMIVKDESKLNCFDKVCNRLKILKMVFIDRREVISIWPPLKGTARHFHVP